jgi:hypothetical protein
VRSYKIRGRYVEGRGAGDRSNEGVDVIDAHTALIINNDVDTWKPKV